MRIFFIGTVEFSYKALQQLIATDANIVGVATKESSAFNSDFADLKPVCAAHNIACKQVNDINHPNNISFIKAANPDVIYCFGWSSLIKKELLDLAPLGVIGFHPAALPYNRGRHPIIWALALGLEQTASSFFFMDEGADTGDILSQETVPITLEDNAATLYEKITITALGQIVTFTRLLSEGRFKRIGQDKESGNTWRKRGKMDGQIDFRMSSMSIYNLVRALTRPYVGAHVATANGDVKVWQVKIAEENTRNIEPGKILAINDGHIKVKTADGAIWLTVHDFEALPKQGEYL
ncbi:MAG TPA: formyltransferase family protein [Chitinophaga sp.]|uniref:formyltransferase family protein n=1 Tax=Chitinophaga sp. TaxID=1869181 RepID=UPI002F91CE94